MEAVKNKHIMEMAFTITQEFVDYPEFSVDEKEYKKAIDDFNSKRNMIAFGVKLLLKRSKIPCEEGGLFVEEEAHERKTNSVFNADGTGLVKHETKHLAGRSD